MTIVIRKRTGLLDGQLGLPIMGNGTARIKVVILKRGMVTNVRSFLCACARG